MRRGRKPWAVWDDRWFRALWYDRRITIVEMARRLGRHSVRPLLYHARELDLPPRREIPGPVGARTIRRSRRRPRAVPAPRLRVMPMAPAAPLARFACRVCGGRSLSPIHPACERAA